MTSIHSLVIGGTRGIGRALVKKLAGQGHLVTVLARREPVLPKADLPNVGYVFADIVDAPARSAALSSAMKERGPFTNVVFFQRDRGTDDSWRGEFDTSLTATRDTIEQFKDSTAPGQGGSIVVVNSVASWLIAAEQPLSYHVGKAGLLQLVRYYAVTLGPKGIRVNSVSLGSVVKEESREFFEKNKALTDLYQQICPLRRLGTSEEVAAAVAFLFSPDASFITGHNLVVDGGVSLQWHESLTRSVAQLEHIQVTRKPS